MSAAVGAAAGVPEVLLDLGRFGAAVGCPLEPWQAEALALPERITTVVAPRQTGKSRSVALLAVHRSLLTPGHHTLIVSAGEEAAKRLLSQVRALLAHPLFRGAVVDEGAGQVTFANGSVIRAVPASERQIRGWSVDLLILDEAAFIPDDLIFSAAFPTTAARPDARIVLASTPWGQGGAFWSLATSEQPGVASFRWALRDAHWISPQFVAQMRSSLSPERFAAEFDAIFSDGGSGLFARADLLDAVAAYEMTEPTTADGGSVLLGCDFGRARDSHAVAGLGVLDDAGTNGHPVIFLAMLDVSRRSYADQVEFIVQAASPNPMAVRRSHLAGPTQGRTIDPGIPRGYTVEQVVAEANGVGAYPVEELLDRLPGRVTALTTTQESKEQAFSRLQQWIQDRRLVLPEDQALLRELLALTAEPTLNGGLRIVGEGGHAGDRAMALSMAALAVPRHLSHGRMRGGENSPLNSGDWVFTPSGISVPRRPRPRMDAFRDLSRVVHGY